MQLSRFGREYYSIEIVTDPQLTDWEASFDQGATWGDGEAVPGQPNTWRWLIHGSDFVAPVGDSIASAVATATFGTLKPHVRAVDNPEVVVRLTPEVDLID